MVALDLIEEYERYAGRVLANPSASPPTQLLQEPSASPTPPRRRPGRPRKAAPTVNTPSDTTLPRR